MSSLGLTFVHAHFLSSAALLCEKQAGFILQISYSKIFCLKLYLKLLHVSWSWVIICFFSIAAARLTAVILLRKVATGTNMSCNNKDDIVRQGRWVCLKIERRLLVIGDLFLACLLVPDIWAHGHVQVYCDVSHLQLHWKFGTAACSLQDRSEREISVLKVHVDLYHSSLSFSLDPWISRKWFLINKCMELNIGEMSSAERNSQYFSEKRWGTCGVWPIMKFWNSLFYTGVADPPFTVPKRSLFPKLTQRSPVSMGVEAV